MQMKMPPALAIARCLTGLVGRNVTAKTVPVAAPPVGRQAVASYVDEATSLKAIGYCDVALGASLGAALVLIPPAVVSDSIKAKEIDPSLTENLYEIFNVLASVFPQNGAPRVLLRALETGTVVADDAKAMIAKPLHRLDLEVAVAGYPAGRMSILTC